MILILIRQLFETFITVKGMNRIKFDCCVHFYLRVLIRKQRGTVQSKIYEFWIKKSSVKIIRSKRTHDESFITVYYMSAIHFHFELAARLSTIFLPFVSVRRRGGPTRYEYVSSEKDSLNPHSHYEHELNSVLTWLHAVNSVKFQLLIKAI